VSNGERRKTKVETTPIVSKSRRTQRRLIQARLQVHPLRIKATRLPRRKFLHLAVGAAALPVGSHIARAQTYPVKPVRIVVGFAAGGGGDVLARLIGQWLSERLGQPFLIENRTGASGNIATEAVVNATPDGYTLLLVSQVNAVNTTLYDKLKFIFHRMPQTLDVNPSVPVKTVPEFIAYAKANPGKLNMGSAGIGAPQHIAGEIFKLMTGINMVHVPYRGGAPAIADLLGGQVQVMFDVLPESIQYIRVGKLRTLAVTTAMRLPALPEIPTVSEFVPGYEASNWVGIGAPKSTPSEIINKLNREINAGLADPKLTARLADLGETVLPGSPADLGTLIVSDTEKWAKVIRAANIKAE
jgi:tripartite-type tricarboxylate transporter receptor subunit TctC